MYSYQEKWTNPEACGAPTCARCNECTSWDLNSAGDGLGYTVATSLEDGGSGTFHCDWSSGCSNSWDEQCPVAATARRNALLAARPGISQQAGDGFTVPWDATIDGFSESGCGPFDQGCSQDWFFHCTLHINNFPTPRTGTHPWCGCAELAQPECPRGDRTFTSTDVPKSIPDNNATGVISVLSVPAGLDVKAVRVNVNITHAFRGDLAISVIAPNGQTAVLANREGGAAQNFIATSRDISSSFSAGSPASGNWTLQVRDLAAANVGTINAFSLEIISTSPTTTTVFTAPGGSIPSNPGAPSAGSSKREFVANPDGTLGPQCMTYDALPTTSSAEIRAKFEKLWSAYLGPRPTTVAAATFTRAIVTRLKLIYELWGEQLLDQHTDTDQTHRAIALYTAYPDDNPSCLPDLDAPAPPASCSSGSVTGTRGDLIRCQRLFGPHASEGVASVALDGCENVLAGYLDLAAQPVSDSACGGPHLRQVSAKASLQLADKQLGLIASAPASLGKLSRQLWLLDRWYELSRRADGLGTFAAADQQRRDTSYLLGRLWDRVRANSTADAALAGLSDASTTDQAETALGLSAVASRQSEQAVVSALFTVPELIQPEDVTLTRPPLRGLPQLALLGDAVKPLVDDLDGLAIYHDIACQFRDCRTPATNTPSRSAWNILASLEASSFGDNVTANSFALGGWNAVFHKLASQQAAFNLAVADAVTKPGGLAGATAEADVHPLARPLWLLYQHARAFHGHFEATGLFESTAQNRLQGSLLEQDQQHVVTTLRGRANALQTTVTQYRNGLVRALEAQITVMDAGARITDLTDQRLRKAAGMDQKSASLEGLRASGEDEADAFASLAASFADVQDALDHGAYVQVGDTDTFQLNGRDGRFTGSSALATVAAHTIPSLVAGQMLIVQATGAWTPTCSISTGRFLRDDGGDPVGADLTNAVIGPEGYAISISGSDIQAHSSGHSRGVEESLGVSVRFCQTTGILEAIGFDGEACVHADVSASSSNTWSGSSGSEARTTAAFATGLRMDNTPFPEAPVGSLLVVLADPATGAVRDIRVVHGGGTSILIENASTAYFVVNDKQCTTAGTEHTLTVHARAMSSATTVAAKALTAMADVLALMRQQQQSLAEQGTMLPTQATLLRQQAGQLLQARLGEISVTELPAPLASLFDAFVSHEIVATERRIEIGAIQRSLDLDLIDLRTVDDELSTGAAHARLQRLVPQWLLRDLDHDQLRNSLVDLLSVSRDFLKPIFELWYPRALDNASVGAEINALISADVETSLVSLASSGESFVNALLDAYENATFGAKPSGAQLPVVVLSFARPSATTHTNMFWRESDAARNQRVWDAIDHYTIAHFEITPEDFYSANGGDAILSCNEVVPVIKTMGVYVVRPGADTSNQTLNGAGRTFHGFGGADQSFVTAQGPRIYQLADPDSGAASVWQSFDMPVRYGESEAALTTFQATLRQTRPVGLSAAGMFDIDFSVLNTLPQAGALAPNDPVPATEIQLILELDSRASGSRPTWVQRCH
jgi:subtilisin-like proprotein convertase family protein